MTPSPASPLATRAAGVIARARYLSLATATANGRPWAAQLQYAWFTGPLRLVMGSHSTTRHAHDIVSTGIAAATISTLPGSPNGLDGIQVAGRCQMLAGKPLERTVPLFYEQMFPDLPEAERRGLSPCQLEGEAQQRLLELRIDEVWILDLERWERDQVSGRRCLDLSLVEAALTVTTGPRPLTSR